MALTSTPLVGFPDAQSTGVRDGVNLQVHNGDMVVTEDGAVISGLDIRGTLRIEADNVTIRDCKVVGDGDSNIVIPDSLSATVEFCDIVGGRNGISGAGTFRSNDISQNENGINVYGPSLIEDNYIHDMAGSPDAHFDGIENNGASGMVMRHNTVINDFAWTSAVMLNNEFGSIDNAIIDNNYLAGGGYVIYSDGRKDMSDPISGVQITNNVLGEGDFGYYAFWENSPLVEGNQTLGTDWPTPVSNGDPRIPDPVDPGPTEPEPTDPGPIVGGPDPVDPGPTEPEPTDPGPIVGGPDPVDPGPTEPEPTDPGPIIGGPDPDRPDPICRGGGRDGWGWSRRDSDDHSWWRDRGDRADSADDRGRWSGRSDDGDGRHSWSGRDVASLLGDEGMNGNDGHHYTPDAHHAFAV